MSRQIKDSPPFDNLVVKGKAVFSSDISLGTIASTGGVYTSDLASHTFTGKGGVFSSDLSSHTFTGKKGTFTSDVIVMELVNTSDHSAAFYPQNAFQSLAASDNISLSTFATVVTAAVTVQLPASTKVGHIKKICKHVSAGSVVVHSSSFVSASDITITSDWANGYSTLMWNGSNWILIDKSSNATLA